MTHSNSVGPAQGRTAPGISDVIPIARTPRRVVFAFLAVIMMVFGAMATAPSADAQSYTKPASNPPMPQKCGSDIALVFDLSNSLSDDDVASSKAAGVAVAEGLAGTPTNVGVFSFATFAPATNNTNLDKVSTAAQTGVDAIKSAVNGLERPPSAHGGTNWDAGLKQLEGKGYDVVYFITDGQPTAYGTPGDGGNNDFGFQTDHIDVDEAVKSANTLKGQNSRIMPLGVNLGDDAAANLALISGPKDYLLVDGYEALVGLIKEEVTKYCRGEINITKQIVNEHDEVTQEAAADWEFSVSEPTAGITLAEPTTASTRADGKVQFRYNTNSQDLKGKIKVTETIKDGSTFRNVKCTGENGADIPVTLENNSFVVPTYTGARLSCVASNSLAGKLKVTKQVIGDDPWNKDFTITAVCTSGTVETLRKSLTLAAGASETLDVPAGSTCSVSEDAEAHQVDGHSLEVTIEGNGGVIKPGATHETTVKNKYSRDLGGLKVTKKVEGYNSGEKTYKITATCKAGGQSEVVRTADLAADGTATFTEIPIGMTCVVSEDEHAAAVNGYALDVISTPSEVTIVEGDPIVVNVTNRYSKTNSSINIVKTINDDSASHTSPGVAVEPGADMDVTYVVTNTGDVTVSDIVVTDEVVEPAAAEVEGINCPSTTLTPGNSVTCSATIKAPEKAGEQHKNTAKVIAKSPLEELTDEDDAYAHTPQATGSFNIIKRITGNAADAAAGKKFHFFYSCYHGDTLVASDGVNITDEGSVTITGIQEGAKCAVSESLALVENTSLKTTITPKEFTVGSIPVTVDVENEYTRVTGGLVITKSVTGNAVGNAPDEFTVNYRCIAPKDAGTVPPGLTDRADESTSQAPSIEQAPPTDFASPSAPSEPASVADELEEITQAMGQTGNDTTDDGGESLAEVALNSLVDIRDVETDARPVHKGTVILANGESVTIDGLLPGTECTVWEDPAPAKPRPGFLGLGQKPGAKWSVEYTVNDVVVSAPAKAEINADQSVQVGINNKYDKTSDNGLVIIPIPVPIPGGGSSLPPTGSSGSSGSSTTEPQQPAQPGKPGEPAQPGKPGEPAQPGKPGEATPVKEQQAKPKHVLAETGANVLWVGGIALLLMAVGTLLALRGRKNES